MMTAFVNRFKRLSNYFKCKNYSGDSNSRKLISLKNSFKIKLRKNTDLPMKKKS